MIKMTTFRLGELGRIVSGKTPAAAKPEYFGTDVPFLTPTDIDGVARHVTTGRFLSEAGAQAFERLLLPAQSVCCVCIGATIGKVCLTQSLAVSNQQINSIVVDQARHDPRYVFYKLLTLGNALKARAGGAATPIVNKSQFSDLEVELPDIELQSRIADVLSAYDDLIENNMRRIAILEEMARRIFEDWFVYFHAPGCDGLPLVDSSIGLIPKGWEVKRLDEIVAAHRDATKPGEHLSQRAYVPIDCIAKRSLYLPEVKSWGEAQSSLITFERNDVLFGAMRPYFHKVCLAPLQGVTRSTCFVLRAHQSSWRAFAALHIFGDRTVAFASANTQGTTIPYAVWEGSLAGLECAFPPANLIEQFNALVDPMLSFIQVMHFTQSNLRAQRNLLLQKLISGEVDISASTLLKAAAE